MTEVEALELIATYTANALESFSLYLSFTAAFLITAYFVGNNLTGFQTFAASSLYCTAAVSAFLALMASVQAWVAIKESTSTVLDSVPIYSPSLWLTMMPLILAPGILVSLYFMWSIRHPKAE